MESERTARLDPEIRRLAAERPDSVVGVLVRTVEPIDDARRRALEDAGLSIGTVAGDIATGTIAAGRAPALARLPSVAYVEAGRRIPTPRPGTLDASSTR